MDNNINEAEILLSAIWGQGNEKAHFVGSLKNKQFKNRPVNSVKDAVKVALELSIQGVDAYLATGGFSNHSSRLASNAVGAWGFWIDIDCGQAKYDKGEGYLTKKDAGAAIIKFCKDERFTHPTHLVDSGNGLHLYWALDRFIPSAEWQELARKFKAITAKYGLIADPARTADIASVLRVPGTNNYKDASNPKLVKLKYAKPNIHADEFINAINASNEANGSNQKLLGNNLALSHSENNEPFTFTPENAQEFLSAAYAAYPNGIPDRQSFFELGMSCAELVVVHNWPEQEVRKILDEICSWPEGANTDNNDAEWQNYLSGTKAKVKQGERLLSHRSIFAKARENGWQPRIEAVPN